MFYWLDVKLLQQLFRKVNIVCLCFQAFSHWVSSTFCDYNFDHAPIAISVYVHQLMTLLLHLLRNKDATLQLSQKIIPTMLFYSGNSNLLRPFESWITYAWTYPDWAIMQWLHIKLLLGLDAMIDFGLSWYSWQIFFLQHFDWRNCMHHLLLKVWRS